MSDGGLGRLERELEDVQLRLRTVENVDTPRQRELRNDLRDIIAKVDRINTEGAQATQIEVREIKKDIEALNTSITGMVEARREESQWVRRMMLSALFAAMVALGLWLVQFLIGRHP